MIQKMGAADNRKDRGLACGFGGGFRRSIFHDLFFLSQFTEKTSVALDPNGSLTLRPICICAGENELVSAELRLNPDSAEK
ncbi:MAG: hypothetical protein ACXW48_21425 [Candidatus Binatia bacterium]